MKVIVFFVAILLAWTELARTDSARGDDLLRSRSEKHIDTFPRLGTLLNLFPDSEASSERTNIFVVRKRVILSEILADSQLVKLWILIPILRLEESTI